MDTNNACVHQPEQKKTAASPNKSNPQIKSSVAMKTKTQQQKQGLWTSFKATKIAPG
jgi:hypothetical protein